MTLAKAAALRLRGCALVLILVSAMMAGCTPPQASQGDQAIAQAFAERESGVEVSGSGTVTRILSDDNNGGRHQRFIVELASGQTLLVAHNIDVAPRVARVAVGDSVEFRGVYEFNDEGGVVHWTHLDPQGTHEPGWLKHEGVTYQ